jgi:two-component system OmpR family sensor kinase
MIASNSITRRLVVTVLVLELVSALALIGAIVVHERDVQLKAFDSSLIATAQSLMGAVQDTEDEADDVMLDMRGVQLAKAAIFRVEDERGDVLGSAGDLPRLEAPSSSGAPAFRDADVNGRAYRFLILHALRIVDPGTASGGVRHSITIMYGTPVGHVWHEVLEAVRFFAFATAFLLGITAIVMAWLVRKGLAPVYELAREAEQISSSDWHFEAPESAKRTIELRPLAAALEVTLARLRRSFEQQKRFTSDAAHELKTGLAIVKSSLQLLAMRNRSAEEYRQGLALSLEDFTRLESMVLQMLTLARLQQPANNNNSESALHSCSLTSVIEEALHQSQALAELKTLKVEFHSHADAMVPLDSRDALLLCSNIFLNALQHSPEGATVRIALEVAKTTACLTVQDQGEGIPEKDVANIFEPFYRGDPSRSRKSGGTGLGLSICRAICERAGGAIEIRNNPGGGALVTVTLPAEPILSSPTSSASLKPQHLSS